MNAAEFGLLKIVTRLLFLLYSFIGSYLIHSDALIQISDQWRYAKGSTLGLFDQQPPWYSPNYNDLSWQQARGGFVGGVNSLQQATPFTDFGFNYHSVFFRTTFEVLNPEHVHNLIIRLQFKHGIILWLNGHPIFTSGFDEMLPVNVDPLERASWRPDLVFEELLLNHAIPFLRVGKNTLAAQVHASVEQSAFSFVAELTSNFSRQPMVHYVTPSEALISWRTPAPTRGSIQYGLVRDNLNHEADFEADTLEPEVLLESLLPGCKYYYQVVTETSRGQIHSGVSSFVTPDDQSTSVRFSVLGDSGRGSLAQYRIAEQIRQSKSELVIHTGDTVYPSLIPELVDLRHYSIYGSHMRSIPYYVAIGNHDLDKGRSIPATLFHLPANDTSLTEHQAEATLPEYYYSVRHGPAEFFVLFAPFFYQYELTKGNPQYSWFERELSKSTSPWKFIVLHHPLRTSSLHRFDDYNRNLMRDTDELGDLLLPLANKHNVQMIFYGHDHVYERFQPVSGAVSILTAAGGGSLYPLRERDALSVKFLRQYHFVNVAIDGNICRFEALDDEGNKIDDFMMLQHPTDVSSYLSQWHTPIVEAVLPNDGDGNLLGQHFDFIGTPLVANLGEYSHAGSLIVHNDADHLYLGFQSVTLPDNGALMLFMGMESEANVESLSDHFFFKDLKFEDWNPQYIGVFGDEFADFTQGAFDRSANGQLGPQGLFYVGEELIPVKGVRIQQYNLSPQLPNLNLNNTHLNEQNANFIEVAIPLESIPDLTLNSHLRLSVISGMQPYLDQEGAGSFDHSLIGGQMSADDPSDISMKGISVRLSLGPDSDGDGLSDPEEVFLKTNIDEQDTDGDGLPDSWEVQYGLSPILAFSNDGKQGDPDKDGLSNIHEWLAKTDPQDDESKLELTANLVEQDVLQLEWHGMPGISYQLKMSPAPEGPYKSLLSSNRFNNEIPIPGVLKHHLSVSETTTRFFQLVVDVESP